MIRPITVGQREKFRGDLPGDLEQVQHTLGLARGCLAGPDPEAALGYLACLGALVDDALAKYRAVALAGGVPVTRLRQPKRSRRTA